MQVIFAVADVARSAEFYEGAFGWPRNPLVDYSNYVEFLPPDGGALGVYERDGYAGEVGAEPVEPGDASVAPGYLYLRVDDVEDTVAALGQAGARARSPLAERAWESRPRGSPIPTET